MVDSIISSLATAPWLHKLDTPSGQIREWGQRFLGDMENGPWIYINSLEPNRTVPPHVHSADEVVVVMEGHIIVDGKECGPGTIIYNKAFNEYGFMVGPDGVLFVNIRSGLATYAEEGSVVDPWAGSGPAGGMRAQK